MVIALGSDHAGFEQKEKLKEYLSQKGYTVTDEGCYSEERCDYPDFAVPVARDVAAGRADRGILVCGTGIGMAMAADKVPGIRAANVTLPELAPLCRQHNDANVLTLSGRFVSLGTNKQIVDAFLTTKFEGGRHQRRVNKIMELDKKQN